MNTRLSTFFTTSNNDPNINSFQNKIRGTIEGKLPNIGKNAFIDAAINESQIKMAQDDNSVTGTAKLFLTGIIGWGMYRLIKQGLRENHLIQLKAQNNVTAQQAMLEFFSSFLGQDDLDSLKYRVLKRMFGITAKTNEEARQAIACCIETLNETQHIRLNELKT